MEAQQLGPYVLIKRLGRGGMGAVYEAEHQKTGEHVAVKVLASHLADDLGLKEHYHLLSIVKNIFLHVYNKKITLS